MCLMRNCRVLKYNHGLDTAGHNEYEQTQMAKLSIMLWCLLFPLGQGFPSLYSTSQMGLDKIGYSLLTLYVELFSH